MSESATISDPKIPIGRTLAAAYGTLFKNLWPFAQIALFPLALGVLLPYLWAEIYPPLYDSLVPLIGYDRAVSINSLNLQGLVERVAAWLALVLFMSHWLQFIAARESGGNTSDGKAAIIRVFSRNDPHVLRYGLLLLVPTVCAALIDLLGTLFSTGRVTAEPLRAVLAAIDSFPILFALTVALIDALVAGRSAPVFAAAAVGKPISLSRAWQITQRQTLRLMLLWMLLFSLTSILGLPLQNVVNDLYVDVIITLSEPGQYIGSYYSPPFTQLITLPSAAVYCAAMALGASLFWRVYYGNASARDKLLERFD